ncbi:MAG: tRNA epoxyqueuosine(34) reductase QueG [Anaerolineales bacterium]
MSSLTQAVKDEAHRLGFILVGVTTPEPPLHWSTYENWLAAGRHGEMAYLAREEAQARRRAPRTLLPPCKSILVLAVPYPNPRLVGQEAVPAPLRVERLGGQVAAYAWGGDYHLVLPGRLKALVAFLEARAGNPLFSRLYTDTGPILERDLAQRAGLGWIGKNTCLIHPRLGSYFLLAEILISADLEIDAPFVPDRCGTCTRCIQACPTACILPDRTLDARRCISYLTIELKGAIPTALRPALGSWVFGCDVCQMVCPWNRFAASGGDPAFAPRPAVPRPDLIADLGLTLQDFNRRFKESPVKRARWRGYLRNLAVALGNSGQQTALPILDALLQTGDPLVQEHARWARGQIRAGAGADSPSLG